MRGLHEQRPSCWRAPLSPAPLTLCCNTIAKRSLYAARSPLSAALMQPAKSP
jgi:hypothetical protein